MMLFRSLLILSLATAATADFAEDTCSEPEWVPQPDNSASPTGRVRCCAGQHGKGSEYAKCDTSSCVNNFGMKNRNCFNYGAPQNGKHAKDNQGSTPCPYADSDHAICDTSHYDDLNDVSCRMNPAGKNFQVHCLGKVRCNTLGVDVPRNGHSDGTAESDGTGEVCAGATEGFAAGDDCFYDGSSENWKVCKGEATAEEIEEVILNPDPVYVPEPEPESVAVPPEDDTMTRSSPPGAKGDPHFKTHGGEMYDFHGGCDLVLMDNPDFHKGLGMRIHIRTKINTWWSYVESAVVQIGDETLEITGGESTEQWYHTNGVANAPLEDKKWELTKFAGLVLRTRQEGCQKEAHIYLGNGERLTLKTYYDFVKVEMNAEGSEHYTGSLGLLGRFPDGKRVGRDGETLIADVNSFGQEWQVKPEEPKLFHSYAEEWVVPAGEKCAMPVETVEKTKLRQRRLANGMPMKDAEKACSHLESAEERKACVFDVVATQDVNMASVW